MTFSQTAIPMQGLSKHFPAKPPLQSSIFPTAQFLKCKKKRVVRSHQPASSIITSLHLRETWPIALSDGCSPTSNLQHRQENQPRGMPICRVCVLPTTTATPPADKQIHRDSNTGLVMRQRAIIFLTINCFQNC